MSTADWVAASSGLPDEGETVLLHIPGFLLPRPLIATLRRGDPTHDGEWYRRDHWHCAAILAIGSPQVVQPDHVWCRIPTPSGVDAWADTRMRFDAATPPESPPLAPAPPPAHQHRQPTLFDQMEAI